MRLNRSLREHVLAFYPDPQLEIRYESPDETIMVVRFGPSNPLTGVLRERLLREIDVWPVVAKIDDEEGEEGDDKDLLPQDWEWYITGDDLRHRVVEDSPMLLPAGFAVFEKKKGGTGVTIPGICVAMERDPVRAIEPKLPKSIEKLQGWIGALPDVDEAAPSPPIVALADAIMQYFKVNLERKVVHLVTAVPPSGNVTTFLGRQATEKKRFNYGPAQHKVVAVAIKL